MLVANLKRLVLPLIVVLGGCSELYEFTYDVTIADDVEVEAGMTVRMAMGTSPTDPGQLDDLDETEEDLGQGERKVQAIGTACCQFLNEVNLFAYIDLDDSGSWDEGEP